MCYMIKKLVDAIKQNYNKANPKYTHWNSCFRKERNEKEKRTIKAVIMQKLEVCLKISKKQFLPEQAKSQMKKQITSPPTALSSVEEMS